MKRSTNYLTAIGAALAMAVLILDTKTALAGGAAGIKLCLQTLIPSLFPFFLTSYLLTSSLSGRRIGLLRPLGRLLRIPAGSESLVLIGFLGGYPVGAQAVARAYDAGSLTKRDARRMLAFCSNAGPAFLFGIGARAFPQLWICWVLWAIHMISAVLVGILTPGGNTQKARIKPLSATSLPDALLHSVMTMGLVCGWVLIFRVLLAFLERWFLWLLPTDLQIALSGILELANGCCTLTDIENTGLRLQLFSSLLGFGGLCVALQTRSVAAKADTGLYLPGKLTQAAISMLLCVPVQLLLPAQQRWFASPLLYAAALLIPVIYTVFLTKLQNNSSNPAAAVV